MSGTFRWNFAEFELFIQLAQTQKKNKKECCINEVLDQETQGGRCEEDQGQRTIGFCTCNSCNILPQDLAESASDLTRLLIENVIAFQPVSTWCVFHGKNIFSRVISTQNDPKRHLHDVPCPASSLAGKAEENATIPLPEWFPFVNFHRDCTSTNTNTCQSQQQMFREKAALCFGITSSAEFDSIDAANRRQKLQIVSEFVTWVASFGNPF